MARARKKPSKLGGFQPGANAGSGVQGIPNDCDFGAPAHFAARPAMVRSVLNGSGKAVRVSDDLVKGSKVRPVRGARAATLVIVEDVEGDANGRKRRRELHPLEAMHNKGMISRPERNAGLMLRDAWERTQCSPSRDLSEDRVDTSRVASGTEMQIEAVERLALITRQLPDEARRVCDHVCCNGMFLRDGFSRDGHDMRVHLEVLRMGLGVVADAASRGII